MADENNLTTLAKRLRPLLGRYIENLAGQLIGEGPGIDVVKSGNLNMVGLGGDTILLYHANGNPVSEYTFTDTGINAALAAATAGDIIQLPAGTLTLSTSYYFPGPEIESRAVDPTDTDGELITGLTVSNWYALEFTGGPIDLDVDRSDTTASSTFQFDLNDGGGGGWLGRLGSYSEDGLPYTYWLTLPGWAAFAEFTDAYRARIYFQAATVSVRFRCWDFNDPGLYADNSGSMGFKLCEATLSPSIEVPAGVEIVGLGKNSIIDGSIRNNGILTNLEVTGQITGSGVERVVANPDNELFSEQIRSVIPTGVSPFNVDSTTLNTNLNADLLDGHHSTDFITALPDHDHSGDSGDGGQFDADHLLSTGANDGDVLTSDGAGNAAWEPAAGGVLADHDHSGDAGDGGQFDANHLLSTGAADGDIFVADGAGNADFEPGVDIGSDAADIDAINVNEQVSDPAQPGAGHRLIFAKNDGIYEEDSSGIVTGPFGVGSGTDPDAIHVNVDNEISGIANKATPVAGDLIVIEDSEDGFNKKSVDIDDLPGGATSGKYRQFTYEVDAGDLVFVVDDDGFPVFMLLDLE